MSSQYINTTTNRIFVQKEEDNDDSLEMNAAVLAPALELAIKTKREQLIRDDKTGVRTTMAVSGPVRDLHEFYFKMYGTGWDGLSGASAAAVVGESAFWNGLAQSGVIEVVSAAGAQIGVPTGHGLEPGFAVGFGGEIRFVEAILSEAEIQLNAPFSIHPGPGSLLESCLSLKPGDSAQSLAILDDWSPASAVKRLLKGAVVDRLKINVNSEFLEMEAYGYGKRLYDSVVANYPEGQQFPNMPSSAGGYSNQPIPGHLGQVWIGSPASRVCALTAAEIEIDNNIEARTKEFGCFETKDFVPGKREVRVSFSVYERTDEVSRVIYEKATKNEAVSLMIQVGNQPGSLFAVYLPAVLFPSPEFDDSKNRLIWRFSGGIAVGGANDDVFIGMK